MVQVHAWLAGLGFGFLLPIGILVARHLKVWMDPAWFYTHIGIQFCGYLLGVIGWGYGIWLHMQPSAIVYPMNEHYGIGVTIFVTSTLQVRASTLLQALPLTPLLSVLFRWACFLLQRWPSIPSP